MGLGRCCGLAFPEKWRSVWCRIASLLVIAHGLVGEEDCGQGVARIHLGGTFVSVMALRRPATRRSAFLLMRSYRRARLMF